MRCNSRSCQGTSERLARHGRDHDQILAHEAPFLGTLLSGHHVQTLDVVALSPFNTLALDLSTIRFLSSASISHFVSRGRPSSCD